MVGKKYAQDSDNSGEVDIRLVFEEALQRIRADEVRALTRAAVRHIESTGRTRVMRQLEAPSHAPSRPEPLKAADAFHRVAEHQSKLYADDMVVGRSIHHARAQFWAWAMAEYGQAETPAVAPAIFEDTLLNIEDGYRHLAALPISILTLEAMAQFFEYGPTVLRHVDRLSALLDAVADWTGPARYLGDVSVQKATDPAPVVAFPAPGSVLVGRAYRQVVAIGSFMPEPALTEAQRSAVALVPPGERSLIAGEVDYLPVPEQIGWMFSVGPLFDTMAAEPKAIFTDAGDPFEAPEAFLLDTRLVSD